MRERERERERRWYLHSWGEKLIFSRKEGRVWTFLITIVLFILIEYLTFVFLTGVHHNICEKFLLYLKLCHTQNTFYRHFSEFISWLINVISYSCLYIRPTSIYIEKIRLYQSCKSSNKQTKKLEYIFSCKNIKSSFFTLEDRYKTNAEDNRDKNHTNLDDQGSFCI